MQYNFGLWFKLLFGVWLKLWPKIEESSMISAAFFGARAGPRQALAPGSRGPGLALAPGPRPRTKKMLPPTHHLEGKS